MKFTYTPSRLYGVVLRHGGNHYLHPHLPEDILHTTEVTPRPYRSVQSSGEIYCSLEGRKEEFF